jgi:hypothetical protein
VGLKKKLLILGAVAAFGGVAYIVIPRICIGYAVARSLHDQGLLDEAARPRVDAIMGKIRVGDSLAQAEKALTEGRLSYEVDRIFPPPRLESLYRAGPDSGYSITLELGPNDKIAKIDVREVLTGP